MKSVFKYVCLLLASVLVPGLCACDDKDDPPVGPSDPGQIVLGMDVVEINSTGGRGFVTYSLENVADSDAEVSVSSDAGWIGNFDTAVEGRIAFTVDPNVTDQPREAVVKVSCAGVDDVAEFKVKQSLSDDFFTIEGLTSSELALTAKITPRENDVNYLVMIMPKSQMDNYKSDDEIYADDVLYMKEYADKLCVSFETLLGNYVRQGEQVLEWSDLSVATPYCIYAYGVDGKGNRITSITKAYLETTDIVETPVNFDIDFVVSGPVVDMIVTPSDNEVLYYFNMLDATVSDAEICQIVQNNVDQVINQFLMYGYTLEQAVEATCFTGQQFNTFSRALEPEHEYVGFAMTVSKSGVVSNKVTRKNVTTGKVSQSQNVLDIRVSDIKTRSAHLKVVPSNDDSYILAYAPLSYYGELGDDEVIQFLSAAVRQGILEAGSGACEVELVGLEPDTDYEVLAVGMEATYPTTGLFRVRFRTNKSEQADVTVNVEFSKYFAAGDAAEKWPGQGFEDFIQYAILPVSVSTDGSNVYYNMYSEDLTDISDELIINDLVQYGHKTPQMNFFVTFGSTNTLCAVAEDGNGNFGKVFRQEIVLTRDGVSPIDELDFTPTAMKHQNLKAKAVPAPVSGKRMGRVADLGRTLVLDSQTASYLMRVDAAVPGNFIKNIMLRKLPIIK